MKLFSVQPLDFLVKPVKKEELFKAIKRGLEIIGESEDYFTYKSGRTNNTICCKEILYFMSNTRVISIVCRDEIIQFIVHNYYFEFSCKTFLSKSSISKKAAYNLFDRLQTARLAQTRFNNEGLFFPIIFCFL